MDPKTGKLDNNRAVKALLTHRNTPCQQNGISPAIALFGRPIRDHLLIQDLRLEDGWQQIADKREEAMARRHVQQADRNISLRSLEPLNVGDSVQIQNQHGNHPTKWNNTGFIAETLPNRQYHVVVDGSQRKTLRNRRFLRPILPSSQRPDAIPDPPSAQPPPLQLQEDVANETKQTPNLRHPNKTRTTD